MKRGLADSLQVRNFSSVMEFGAREQKQISDYSNWLSDQMSRLDDSKIRGHLGELLKVLAKVDLKPFSRRRFLFWWLPPKRPSLQQTGFFKKMLVELDYVGHRLGKSTEILLQEVALLDGFYDENERYRQAVERLEAAGRKKYEELAKLQFADPESRADLLRFLELLDARLYDLQVSQQLAAQKGVQIRMLQESHRRLALKIQSSILNTIPLWQDQLSLALAVERQGETAKALGELLTEQAQIVEALNQALRS